MNATLKTAPSSSFKESICADIGGKGPQLFRVEERVDWIRNSGLLELSDSGRDKRKEDNSGQVIRKVREVASKMSFCLTLKPLNSTDCIEE